MKSSKEHEIVELFKAGKVLEAQEQIIHLRKAELDLREANLNLKERIRELEATLSLVRNFHFEDGYFWNLNDGKREGPFCAVCFDKDKKAIHLHDGSNQGGGYKWVCLVCNQGFGVGSSPGLACSF